MYTLHVMVILKENKPNTQILISYLKFTAENHDVKVTCQRLCSQCVIALNKLNFCNDSKQ